MTRSNLEILLSLLGVGVVVGAVVYANSKQAAAATTPGTTPVTPPAAPTQSYSFTAGERYQITATFASAPAPIATTLGGQLPSALLKVVSNGVKGNQIIALVDCTTSGSSLLEIPGATIQVSDIGPSPVGVTNPSGPPLGAKVSLIPGSQSATIFAGTTLTLSADGGTVQSYRPVGSHTGTTTVNSDTAVLGPWSTAGHYTYLVGWKDSGGTQQTTTVTVNVT